VVRLSGWVIVCALCVAAPSEAVGQVVPALPGAVQPGGVERSLEQRLPSVAPDTVRIPSPQGFEAPAGAEKFHFVLRHITITGAHALSGDQLKLAYQALIGRDVTLADIYAAARAITDLYARHDYAISFAMVPAQEIDKAKGEVRIDVIEGYVGRLSYSGKSPYVARLYGDHILASRPLLSSDLDHSLLLMNDLPGLTAHGVFQRLDNAPAGDTELAIAATQDPLTGQLSFDNRGSRAFGPWRASLNVGLNSLLGLGEQVAFTGVRALNANELSYGAVKTSLPLGGGGWVFSTNTTYTSAHPGTPLLTSAGLNSSGWTSQASVSDPVLRSRFDSLWLWGGVSADWLHSDFFTTPNSQDHIFSLQGGLIWNSRDAFGQTALDATVSQGLPVFGAAGSVSPLRSRINGSGVYTSLKADATRLQALPANFGLYLAAKGQFASRGLLAPDQCGYGGGSIGHGFDDNEIVGDHCVEGLAELRFTPQIEGKILSQIQPFISFDAGAVWNEGPAEPGTYSHATGDSAGAGLRAELFHEVQLSVEYDKPIGRDVALEGNRNGRLFFFVGAAW